MSGRDPDANGWVTSAQAWIDRMPEEGDFARAHILDRPLLERVRASGAATLLDIGCGEGRFCRLVRREGVAATGLDPSARLLNEARRRDPSGRYALGCAEALPFREGSFDLALFYLSLIDVDDMPGAVREAARVLKPGGHLLIANLTSFFTSNGTLGWVKAEDGGLHHPLGVYLEERADWVEWEGVCIRNWHRPLSAYMSALLGAGLTLTYFDEPAPTGGPIDRVERYRQTPFTMIMEWRR